MSRTRVRRRRRALAIVLAGCAFAAGPVARAAGGPSADDREVARTAPAAAAHAGLTYVVAPGDTLWRISTRAAPGRDPRPLIDAIESLNGIQASDLVPGQTLLIPSSV